MPRPTGPQRLEARRRRLERHAVEEDPAVVLNAAARFLEVRSRSVDEVRRHLAAARYPAGLIERAVARLLELGMLDDRAFGRAWVESRDRARPRGEQALRRELSLKGLERELIAEILAERAGQGEAPDDGFGRLGLGIGGAWGRPAGGGEPAEATRHRAGAHRRSSGPSPARLRTAGPQRLQPGDLPRGECSPGRCDSTRLGRRGGRRAIGPHSAHATPTPRAAIAWPDSRGRRRLRGETNNASPAQWRGDVASSNHRQRGLSAASPGAGAVRA